MSERIVLVLEYDSEYPLIESIMQIIQHVSNTDLPDANLIRTHIAIREDADKVIDVFDKKAETERLEATKDRIDKVKNGMDNNG